MSVDTFLSRLCALVPPPRFHMTRYYGEAEALIEAEAGVLGAGTTYSSIS